MFNEILQAIEEADNGRLKDNDIKRITHAVWGIVCPVSCELDDAISERVNVESMLVIKENQLDKVVSLLVKIQKANQVLDDDDFRYAVNSWVNLILEEEFGMLFRPTLEWEE